MTLTTTHTDTLNHSPAQTLHELEKLRHRYLALLNQYAIERHDRMLTAGLSQTEANDIDRATRDRWRLDDR